MNEPAPSGLYKTTVVFYTARPASGMTADGLLSAFQRGEALSPPGAVRSVLVPLPGDDPDWDEALSPGRAGKIPLRLLCDRCFEAVSGEFAQCQPGCLHGGLDADGACLWPGGPDQCGWCGRPDRLTPVPADHDGIRRLPAVGERGEGQWRLIWPGSDQGPYPSEGAA